jgi:cytochrome c peroxidase
MASTKKSNKLKRKRGKKFIWHGDKDQAEEDTKKAPQEENPFEQHSKSKSAVKDLERRQALLEEYRNQGKNT